MKFCTLFLLLAPAANAQSTWYVDSSGLPPGSGTQGDPYTSIQYAIDQGTTASGDTLLVASGTYTELIDLGSKDLVIEGQGATAPLITSVTAGSLITITGGQTNATVLRRLELLNGFGSAIGIDNVRHGGGLLIDGSAPRLIELTIRQCRSSMGGGLALLGSSSVRMTNSVIDGSYVFGEDSRGGGVYVDSTSSLELERVEFRHCRAGTHAPARGAGIHSDAPAGQVTVVDCLFHDNGFGSASPSELGLERGGAFSGAGVFSNCVFTDNHAIEGGALAGDSVATECLFERNYAAGRYFAGGGAGYQGTYDACVFRQNRALERGGAVLYGTLTDCRVVDNVVTGTDAYHSGSGGGLANCTAWRSYIAGNSVEPLPNSRGGGAAFSELFDCTLVDNVADRGGAVVGTDLRYCTVYRNTGRISVGGVIDNNADQIRNCIVWGNSGAQLGPLTPVNDSLVQGGWPGNGNIGGDPLFWSDVQPDLHLRPGSPCIGASSHGTDLGSLPFDSNYFADSGAFCVGKLTSAGCVPSVGFSGVPSVTQPGLFDVQATDVIGNSPGILFWSANSQASPFLGGTLCVGAPQTRSAVLVSTGTSGQCDGTFTYSMDAAFFGGLGIAVSDPLFAQIWFRDPLQPDGTGIGLTDGLEIILRP